MKENGGKEEDLASVQKNIENATKKVVHWTKAQGEREIISIPENVRMCEKAAARCATKIKRALRRQARKARAEHLVKCSFGAREEKGPKESR